MKNGASEPISAALATLLFVAPAKKMARFRPKNTPGTSAWRTCRIVTRRPVLQRYTFHTTVATVSLQNATSTPGVSARFTSVELSEKPMTTPATASAPRVRARVLVECSSRSPADRPERLDHTVRVEELSDRPLHLVRTLEDEQVRTPPATMASWACGRASNSAEVCARKTASSSAASTSTGWLMRPRSSTVSVGCVLNMARVLSTTTGKCSAPSGEMAA